MGFKKLPPFFPKILGKDEKEKRTENPITYHAKQKFRKGNYKAKI